MVVTFGLKDKRGGRKAGFHCNLFIVLLSGVAATISCYDSFVSRRVLGIYQPFIPATSLRRVFPYSH